MRAAAVPAKPLSDNGLVRAPCSAMLRDSATRRS